VSKILTIPVNNKLKFEDDIMKRSEAMKVNEEVPPQDEKDDGKSNEKMEKKEEAPSHDEEDDEKRKEKMKVKVKAEAPPHDENNNEVPQGEEDEDVGQKEDELLAWFQPFIAQAKGYPECATHFASHYENWDYFDF
jgi:hypothetical protein